MLLNKLHPEKAHSPIAVTESGMVTVFTAVLSTPHASHESPKTEAPKRLIREVMGMLKCPSALTLKAAIDRR